MRKNNGLSIMEVVVSLGIFALLIGAISALQSTIFRSNRLAGTRVDIDQRSLSILRRFTTDVRAAQTSHDGGSPIAEATDSSIAFYADTNESPLIERIRYSVENGSLVRGVIVPSGQPLIYDPDQERITTLISNVAATPPYFRYYDASFDGVSATTSLALPVTISAIRVVEINLSINTNVVGQAPRTLQTRAMLRSLKNE